MRTFFRSDLNLAKVTIDDLQSERLLKLALHEEIKFCKKKIKLLKKRLNSYIRAQPQLLKKFREKSDKKQKIFFCTTVSKFQEILTLNICDGAKQIYPKK